MFLDDGQKVSQCSVIFNLRLLTWTPKWKQLKETWLLCLLAVWKEPDSDLGCYSDILSNCRLLRGWRRQKGRSHPWAWVCCWTHPSGWRTGVSTSQLPEQLIHSHPPRPINQSHPSLGSGIVQTFNWPVCLASEKFDWHWQITSM